MIKKLYWQIVLTFIGSILLSLVLAFAIADHLYLQNRVDQLNGQVTSLAKEVAGAYEDGDTSQGKQSLDLLAKLDVKSVIYRKDGSVEYSSSSWRPEEKAVKKVLNGGVYKSDSNRRPAPPSPLVYNGYPIWMGEERFALFISPNLVTLLSDFRRVLSIILISILAIGSMLFLITSRFITKPIQQLTAASNELSRGNFAIQLGSRRKDELGNLTASFNQMTRELGKLDSMRKQFVADVSHEIQSPLTSIRGFAQALKDGVIENEQEQKEYLTIIETESRRLSELSQNLLKLAALESEHPPFEPEKIQLDEHIRRTAASLEPQWKAKQQNVDLRLNPVAISGDSRQLNQVWMNLLTNAIRYTDERGTICVTAESDEKQAIIRISDNGAGISKEHQEKIFRRFYKADPARTRENGGSGLGLSIVKRIVELHDGGIQIESEPGEGTLVTVRLPKDKN
ncbi:sensor histidine kinase [Metabacillus sp. 113a]|uniref:sensor histidine kinase n=1 Tax=Metabacillus sp. 113a TaxID=3404706 RepID=UPI003CEDE8F0